jgi:hypothetical protein
LPRLPGGERHRGRWASSVFLTSVRDVHVRDWARGLPGITSQAVSASVDRTVNTVPAAESLSIWAFLRAIRPVSSFNSGLPDFLLEGVLQ